MKRLARRWTTLLLIVVAALAWVALLSLPFGGTGSSRSSDGATGRLTLVDETTFPQLNSYLLLQDQAGQPIQGLQANDFEVTEDGIPVKFDFTSAGQQQISVMLVIDRSGSMADDNKMIAARHAARTFINLLRPGRDTLGVVIFSNAPHTLVPLAAVDDAGDKTQAAAAIDQVYPDGGTYLYDAVAVAVNEMRNTTGRRVILALTDGMSDNGSYNARTSSALAQREGIPIYTIGLGRDVEARQLKQLADATNGEYSFAPSAKELEQLYGDLAQALQNEYRFGYTSPTSRLDGTRRTIAITAKRPTGTLVTSGDYAVSGVLVLNQSPLLLLLLAGTLVGLLAAPTIIDRIRRRTPVAAAPAAVVDANAMPVIEPPYPHEPIPMRSQPSLVAERSPQAPTPASPPLPQQLPALPPQPLVIRYHAPLGKERTAIGSASTNDLQLPGLAPEHAVIMQQAGRWVIEAHGGMTAVSFNGDPQTERPVMGTNALKHGALVRFGPYLAVFEVLDLPSLSFQFQIAQSTILGSTAPSVVPIPLATLRPQHARLGYEGGRWFVEDLGGGDTAVSFSGDPSQLHVMPKSALKRGSLVRMGAVVVQVGE